MSSSNLNLTYKKHFMTAIKDLKHVFYTTPPLEHALNHFQEVMM